MFNKVTITFFIVYMIVNEVAKSALPSIQIMHNQIVFAPCLPSMLIRIRKRKMFLCRYSLSFTVLWHVRKGSKNSADYSHLRTFLYVLAMPFFGLNIFRDIANKLFIIPTPKVRTFLPPSKKKVLIFRREMMKNAF